MYLKYNIKFHPAVGKKLNPKKIKNNYKAMSYNCCGDD